MQNSQSNSSAEFRINKRSERKIGTGSENERPRNMLWQLVEARIQSVLVIWPRAKKATDGLDLGRIEHDGKLLLQGARAKVILGILEPTPNNWR
jgi:hypothetical protein